MKSIIQREITYSCNKSQAQRDAELQKEKPWEYKEAIEDERIIPVEEQKKLIDNDESMFDAFCRLGNAYTLPIYPELSSPALINLELRIINALRSIPTEKELSQVNPQIKERLIQLEITQSGPKEKEELNLPQIKILNYKKVGTHIIATEVWGYRGVLRFDHRDIFRGAPEEANAYRIGKGKLVVVIEKEGVKYCWSPLCYDLKLSPLDIPVEEYHIVPVQYFKIETESPEVRMKKELRRLRDHYKIGIAGTKAYYTSLQKKFGIK